MPELSATEKERRMREDAWLGDAVLALHARIYLLDTYGGIDADAFKRLTSNDFLAGLGLGSPTAVEARIGRLYREEGPEAARAFIVETLLPHFKKREAKRLRAGR